MFRIHELTPRVYSSGAMTIRKITWQCLWRNVERSYSQVFHKSIFQNIATASVMLNKPRMFIGPLLCHYIMAAFRAFQRLLQTDDKNCVFRTAPESCRGVMAHFKRQHRDTVIYMWFLDRRCAWVQGIYGKQN